MLVLARRPTKRSSWIGLLALLLMVLACASARVHASVGQPDDDFITSIMERDGLPGLAAAVIHGNQIAWQGTYGVRDQDTGVPIDVDTVFMLASVSKLIVAAAVLQIHEQGLIDLHEDINVYLPFAVRHPAHPQAPITPYMLLTHRAGFNQPFPDVLDYFAAWPGDSAPPLFPWIPDYILPGGALYRAGMWIPDRPGDTVQYSNMGATLLGYLVEVVTGQDFAEYCKDEIFTPLDMPSSGYRLAHVDPAKLASLYFSGTTRVEQYSLRGYPASTLRSSLAEFAHFLMAILDNGSYGGARILEPETVEEMLRIVYPEEGLALLWWSSDDGWMGHGGNFIGATARIDVHPTLGRALLVFTNVGSAGAVQPGGEIYEEVRTFAVPEPTAELGLASGMATLLLLRRLQPSRRGPRPSRTTATRGGPS